MIGWDHSGGITVGPLQVLRNCWSSWSSKGYRKACLGVLAVVFATIRWKAIQPFILFGYASGVHSDIRCCPGRAAPVTALPAVVRLGLAGEKNSFPSTRNKYVPCQLSSEEKEQTRRSHEMTDAHEGLT